MRAKSLVSFWGIVLISILFPLVSLATIQEMIDAADEGDIILVEAGTYVENIDFGTKNLILRSVAGPELTIIDGNASGTAVLINGGQTANTILEGFTITGGTGWWNGTERVGGGIAVRDYSSPTLRNLIITENQATGPGEPAGGGITIFMYSNPYLENIIISNNTSKWGGGLAVVESAPTFKNVEILGNNATTTGGGIYIGVRSNPRFDRVNISENTATYYGGAGFIHDHSRPWFNRVTIKENVCASGGGGLIINDGSNINIINSIVWGNLPDQLQLWVAPEYESSVLNVAYSDVQDGELGIGLGDGILHWLEGNMDDDPVFGEDGFELDPESQCIDAGIPYFEYDGVVWVDISEEEYFGLAPDLGYWESNFGPQILMVPGDYATIQAAIDAAVDEDTVQVSAGTYVENVDFGEKNLVLRSVAGPELTIIDGNASGTAVLINGGQTANTILEGFTITGGTGWWNGTERVGGGIAVRDYSSPTLRNLIITENQATGPGEPAGGGITIFMYSNPYLENIIISNNTSKWGGGLAVVESAPTFKNVEILGNNATTTGGGIYIGVRSNPRFDRVNISENTATYYGGAGFIHDHSRPWFNRVTIKENVCASGGGGLIINDGSNINIINSIVWGNLPDQLQLWVAPEYESSVLNVAYSDVQDGELGIGLGDGILHWLEGNMDDDPVFGEDGFELDPESQCIDAGIPYFEYDGVVWVDITPDEYSGDNPDMGSFEYQHPVSIDPISDILPQIFDLHQNYPNPFNPSTTINYDLPASGSVTLTIYDLTGRVVNTLINGDVSAGYHSVVWNAVDTQGNPLESGIYLYQLNFRDSKGSETRQTRKFSLLK